MEKTPQKPPPSLYNQKQVKQKIAVHFSNALVQNEALFQALRDHTLSFEFVNWNQAFRAPTHLKKRKWVWSLQASESGSFSGASPRRALQIPIFVSFQTDDIPYNPKHYDAASEITEGVAAFPNHLHQYKLFSELAFQNNFFVVVENHIFRKNIRKTSVTELCIFRTEFAASQSDTHSLENKRETNTASCAEAFGHFVSNLYVITAFIQGLPQHDVTSTLNTQSQCYPLSSMSTFPNYPPKSFDLFKSLTLKAVTWVQLIQAIST